MHSSRALSIVAFAVLAAAQAAAQTVPLRLNLKPGATFTFKSTSKMTTSGAGAMSSMGNIGQTMAMTIKCLSQSAKGTAVQMKVTDVQFDAPADSPVGKNLAEAAKGMKGALIEQLFSAQAKALSSKLVGGGPGGQQLLNQFGATRTGFLGVEFPAAPVAVGGKWATAIDFGKVIGSAVPGMVQTGKNSKLPIQYTLTRIETRNGKRVAVIGFTMVGTMDLAMGGGAAPPGRQPMPAMKFTVNVQTKGSFDVDVASGLPLRGATSGTTKTAIGGMNIMQSISTAFTVK